MRVLLSVVALTMLWTQMSFATASRASRLLLQSYRDAAWLQSEIDMLVARGYVLFKGSWHTSDESMATMGRQGIEQILIRDADSPVYRHAEQETLTHFSHPVQPPHRSRPLDLQVIAEGEKHKIGDGRPGGRGIRDVVHVKNLLSTTYSSKGLSLEEKHKQGLAHYDLQAEDGLYPDTPADSDQVTSDNKRGKHIETITINADNPKTIYRHSLVLNSNGEVVSERLSVGTVGQPATGLTRVKETMVNHEVLKTSQSAVLSTKADINCNSTMHKTCP